MSSPGSYKSNMLFLKDKKEVETEKRSSKAAGMKDKQRKLPGKSGRKKKKKKKEEDFLTSLLSSGNKVSEHICGMTGKMPSRKVKRRTKNVQKQIEIIFPGGSLGAITVNRYKVFENSWKGK